MKYFTIQELLQSSTAEQKGIDNTPDKNALDHLKILIEELLDPVREKWGGPITVNSGYRSAALNRAVGGVSTSQHALGQAADITVGSKEDNKKLFDLIKDNFMYDQLIDEKDYSWVHVSYRPKRNRLIQLHLQ